ncbi:MAG: hypothetical protein QXV17_11420 [Candidatus Micrarchaeaceae archaeon]
MQHRKGLQGKSQTRRGYLNYQKKVAMEYKRILKDSDNIAWEVEITSGKEKYFI